MIVTRWLGIEIQKHTYILLVGLIVLVVAQRLIGVLGKVVAGKIPADVVWLTLLYYLPEVLSILLPICFSLAVIFLAYRLQKNHELEALRSLRFSDADVTTLLVKQGTLIGVVTFILVTLIAPWGVLEQDKLKSEVGVRLWQQYFTPGLFQSVEHDGVQGMIHVFGEKNNAMLFSAKVAEGLSDVVVASLPGLVIENGKAFLDTKQGTLHRFSEQGTQRISFEHSKLQLEAEKSSQKTEEAAMSMLELWNQPSTEAKAELLWRLGMSSSPWIIALLLVSLFRNRPREQLLWRFFATGLMVFLFAFVLILLKASVRLDYLPWWLALFCIWLVFGGYASWSAFCQRKLI